mgnify:CR=1 FL=1
MSDQLILIAAIGVLIYLASRLMKKIPQKESTDKNDLSASWKQTLESKVSFYNRLATEKKEEFENRISQFLNSVSITPVDCEVEELDKILIASSAIIPVFNFSNWTYPNLNEVLLYPKPFNAEFSHDGDANIQGMVGNGFMNGKMILSKTSLRLGFQAELDKKNVGIHEFVHLIDGVDGNIDGIPKVLMTQQYSLPWLDLVYRKINEIQTEKTDINVYGATNEQEFLSVASEYFFEHPKQLKKKHPELYEMLNYFYSEKD